MPTAADLVPDLDSTCAECGQHVECFYWIGDRSRCVHAECRDWSQVPFMFDEQLRALRRRARAASREERARLVEVGQCLADAERRWPEGAAELAGEGTRLLRGLG